MTIIDQQNDENDEEFHYIPELDPQARRTFFFDLDGTWIKGYMDTPTRAYDEVHVLPRRREVLAALRAAGHQIGLVTNQGGVAFGYVTEEQAAAKIAAAIAALDLPADTPVAVCYAEKRSSNPRYSNEAACARRKPSGAMIRELMDQLDRYPSDVVYIGDRPEDEQAAANAGVLFMHADQFFAEPAADAEHVDDVELKKWTHAGWLLLSTLLDTTGLSIDAGMAELDRRVEARIVAREDGRVRLAVRVDSGTWVNEPWWIVE